MDSGNVPTSLLTVSLAGDENSRTLPRYDITAAESAAGVTPTNYAYPELHVFRYMTSVQINDVKTRALTLDVRVAIQDAIAVAQQNGGEVYAPSGAYLIRRIAGGDLQFNGLSVPFTNVFGYEDHISIVGDGRSTVFCAGDNSMTVIRWSDSNGRLANFAIDNNSKTGITGLSLIGSDTTNGALAEHIDWNVISRLDIRGCAEGIELESPSAGGCYYNRIEFCTLYSNTRHVRFRDNATKGGANRNSMLCVNMSGGNTGIWNDGADTLQWIGCTFEDISVGISPSAFPTAIVTKTGSLSGLFPESCSAIACIAENCTVDVECGQRRMAILGGNLLSVGALGGSAVPDFLIGGDHAAWMREIMIGGSSATGIALINRAAAYAATGLQVASSQNAAGSFPFNTDGSLVLQARQGGSCGISMRTGATSQNGMDLRDDGSLVVSQAVLATNATAGFAYLPSCAGVPTGTPASYNGSAVVIDTTNNRLYFYSTGAWRNAGP
jgi:hypothetical protein